MPDLPPFVSPLPPSTESPHPRLVAFGYFGPLARGPLVVHEPDPTACPLCTHPRAIHLFDTQDEPWLWCGWNIPVEMVEGNRLAPDIIASVHNRCECGGPREYWPEEWLNASPANV